MEVIKYFRLIEKHRKLSASVQQPQPGAKINQKNTKTHWPVSQWAAPFNAFYFSQYFLNRFELTNNKQTIKKKKKTNKSDSPSFPTG